MLRTDDQAFANLPGWPYAPQYIQLDSARGARMHYVDVAPAANAANSKMKGEVALCLHGNPTWGYLYRKMVPVFAQAGMRVVVPDMIGFGRSDKLEKPEQHSFEFHRNNLLNFVRSLDLQHIMLVVQDWGGIFGLTLPHAMPERFSHALIMNTALATGSGLSDGFKAWRSFSNKNPDLDLAGLMQRGKPDMPIAEAQAYEAPFGHPILKAALQAFPNLVPEFSDSPGAAISRLAASFWQEQWQGQSFMAIGTEDPVLGPPVMEALRRHIRNCPEPMLVKGGHFVQEWGEPIAQAALKHFNAQVAI